MATNNLSAPQFHDADKAREYLEAMTWPNGPVCPHCGVIGSHYQIKGKTTRAGLWKCKDCREPFTVTVGTVFEKSKIPLNKWLMAVYLLASSKKGMSSHQLHRTLGVTYKTAWFMTHRIREAMSDPHFMKTPIGGAGKVVEMDETYFGTETGKSKALRSKRGGAAMNQMNKIVSLVERGGKVKSMHVPSVTGDNLKQIMTEQIHKDSHVMTDSSPRYNQVKREPVTAKYDQINHSEKIYVRGEIHTNTVEGYFSILKRGLVGTYHHVSSEHLKRYLGEFDFRHNFREQRIEIDGKTTKIGYNDAERADELLKRIKGKRLLYKGPREEQVAP